MNSVNDVLNYLDTIDTDSLYKNYNTITPFNGLYVQRTDMGLMFFRNEKDTKNYLSTYLFIIKFSLGIEFSSIINNSYYKWYYESENFLFNFNKYSINMDKSEYFNNVICNDFFLSYEEFQLFISKKIQFFL